ncbi:MAG TPA: ABC transporter permease, partial [Nitrososphaeraceae archaeon]|nr:ABC transporter permease [Nitrososphaeraceae archaeon]
MKLEIKLQPQPHFKKQVEKERRKIKRIDVDDIGHIILFLAALTGIWQLIFSLGIFPKISLPSPAMVAQSFAILFANATLITSIGMTMWRLVISFSISIFLGVGVGLLMVRFRSFGKTMSSFAVGLQSFPSIAWVPFAILLIGLNDFGIFFVVIMSSIFSVMTSTYSGIGNIPTIYLRAAENMGANGLSLFRFVMIPAATPSLIVGIRQAWSFAWHALIGAEILIAASVGLGHILLVGREFQLMDQIIASMIIIFAIGFVVDRVVFNKLEDKVRS